MSVENLFSKKVIPDAESRIRRVRPQTNLASRSLDGVNFNHSVKDDELESSCDSPRNFRVCSSPIQDEDDIADMAQDSDAVISLGTGPTEIFTRPRSLFSREITEDLGRPDETFVYDEKNEIRIRPPVRRTARSIIGTVESLGELKDQCEKLFNGEDDLVKLDGGCDVSNGHFMPTKGSVAVEELKTSNEKGAVSDDDSVTPVNGSIASGDHVAFSEGHDSSDEHVTPVNGSIASEDLAPFGKDGTTSVDEGGRISDIPSGVNGEMAFQNEGECSEDAVEKDSFYGHKISSPCFFPSSYSFSSVSSLSYTEDSSGWSTISSSPLLASSPNPNPAFSLFLPYALQQNPSYHLASKIGPIPNCPLFSRREYCRSDCPFVHNGVDEIDSVARKLHFDESFLEEKSEDVRNPFEMNVEDFPIPKLLTASEYYYNLLTPITREEMMMRKNGPYTANGLLDCDACYPYGPCLFEAMEEKYQQELITDELMKIIFS